MAKTTRQQRLWDAYRFPGFRPEPSVRGSSAIRRRGSLPCGGGQKNDLRPMRLVVHGLVRPSRASNARSSQWSDAHIPALRDTAHLLPPVRRGEARAPRFPGGQSVYTKRFAYYVGRRCRGSAIKEIAEELLLDWDTVKELDKQYMQAQLARAGTPGPKVIGIDEISIRKGHTYRTWSATCCVSARSGLAAKTAARKAWTRFTVFSEKEGKSVRLAVMDMWKPFRNSTTKNAPQAAILFDKFHIIRHLGEALDKVRKSEYARLEGKKRRPSRARKRCCLTRRTSGQRSQESAAAVGGQQASQHRLLAEGIFGQLWEYNSEAGHGSSRWHAQLKWQRLKPYEAFAKMIERHWDGLAAY